MIEDNRSTNVGDFSGVVGASQTTVHKILKDDLYSFYSKNAAFIGGRETHSLLQPVIPTTTERTLCGQMKRPSTLTTNVFGHIKILVLKLGTDFAFSNYCHSVRELLT